LSRKPKLDDRVETEQHLTGSKQERDIEIKTQGQQVEAAVRPEEYESQYDANHDFAIFATKDQALGGFLGLREKQNIVERDEVASQYVDSEADKSRRSMHEDQEQNTDR